MYRLVIILGVAALIGLGSSGASGGEVLDWFGPPPEGFRVTEEMVRGFLGEEFREHPNWIGLEEWLDQLPVPRIQDPDILRGYYARWYELWLNTELPQGAWSAPIICPSITTYARGIWLWDTGFHVLGLVYGKEKAIALAEDQIRVMLQHQHADGRIPREVWADGPRFFGLGVQAPGILSMAALEIYRVTGDWYFIEEVFEPLVKNHEWFRRNTDEDRDGLFGWSGADSGWDESPRWSREVTAAIDLCCWMYLDRVSLAEMAAIVGQEGKATGYQNQARELARRINQWMWDPREGMYTDLGTRRAPTGIKSPASFFPMFAGIASEEQAARMVEQLANPETFRTPYPVPCAAKDTPGFDPDRYWRGNVWINLNWVVIQGLRRYGYHRLADDLSASTLGLIAKHQVSYEYYNPMTGAGLGAKYYGWTAAMFIRLCNELLERRAAEVMEVNLSQSNAGILPPEDVLLSVEVGNVSTEPLADLRVEMESEFAESMEQQIEALGPGMTKAFVFRVGVRDVRRGHTYFHATVTGRQGDRGYRIDRGRTLPMRDLYGCILSLPGGRRIGSGPFQVAAAARNFRVQPQGRAALRLEVPPGWTVEPSAATEVRFPWSNVRDEKTFTVKPPTGLPGGRYVIGSSITYPGLAPGEVIRGGTAEVYRPARWMVVGPFDNPDGKGLETPHPPEASLDLSSEYAGKGGPVGWRLLADDRVAEDGYVDLRGVFSEQEMSVGYAATAVSSATDIEAEVRVGSDDAVAVWVNGERVLWVDEVRSAAPEQNATQVQLRAGLNPVLIKVTQREGDWGFYFRITGADGKPVPGLVADPGGLRGGEATGGGE